MRTRTDQPAPGGAPAHTPRWARLPASAAAGWAATLITTAIAALIRLTHLDNVPRLVFDETYYVKDAWSLIELGYEGTWPADYDASFAAGDTSGLSANASYPVHPPTGKWIIGWGMRLLGQSDPVGWRIMGAICGVITVFLLCRLAQNLFHSPAITALAGAFVATDGIAIVMSRTAILDGFLAMFSLAAFLAVVKDQQDARARLGPRLAAWECTGAPRRGWPDLRAYLSPRVPRPASWRIGPASGPRPWLLAAGVLAGLASSVKWSGVYVLAVLGLYVALREWTTRWRAGHPSPLFGALLADVWWAFALMVPPAVLTYVASWFGWFTHPRAHGHGVTGGTGFLGALDDLWAYHVEMWNFHTTLTAEHTYQSNPFTWLFQVRATSFAWINDSTISGCHTGNCARDIVALGNPLLWWGGVAALLVLLWATARHRNWRTGLVACGYLALYAPWLMYAKRTIFTFYTVAFVPFVALAVAWAVGLIVGQAQWRGLPSALASADEAGGADRRGTSTDEAGGPDPAAISTNGAGAAEDAARLASPPPVSDPEGPAPAGALDTASRPEDTAGDTLEADSPTTVPLAADSAPFFPAPTGNGEGAATGPQHLGGATLSDAPTADALLVRFIAAGAITAAVLACAWYFLPLWTGQVLDYEFWRDHMWLSSWI